MNGCNDLSKGPDRSTRNFSRPSRAGCGSRKVSSEPQRPPTAHENFLTAFAGVVNFGNLFSSLQLAPRTPRTGATSPPRGLMERREIFHGPVGPDAAREKFFSEPQRPPTAHEKLLTAQGSLFVGDYGALCFTLLEQVPVGVSTHGLMAYRRARTLPVSVSAMS